jgi:hypothetical protein
MYTYLNIVIQLLYYHCASFHYDFPNDWGDILIENFISSKLLPVAKYLIVAISLHFDEIASLKCVFFWMQGSTLVNNIYANPS